MTNDPAAPVDALVTQLRERVRRWEATGGYARVTVPLRELQAALAEIATAERRGYQAAIERAAGIVDEHGEAWGLAYRTMTDALSKAIRGADHVE